MTDLLTGNYIDELRREYARTVAPLVAALGPLLDPPPQPGVAANPIPTPTGEQLCCPLLVAGVGSYFGVDA